MQSFYIVPGLQIHSLPTFLGIRLLDAVEALCLDHNFALCLNTFLWVLCCFPWLLLSVGTDCSKGKQLYKHGRLSLTEWVMKLHHWWVDCWSFPIGHCSFKINRQWRVLNYILRTTRSSHKLGFDLVLFLCVQAAHVQTLRFMEQRHDTKKIQRNPRRMDKECWEPHQTLLKTNMVERTGVYCLTSVKMFVCVCVMSIYSIRVNENNKCVNMSGRFQIFLIKWTISAEITALFCTFLRQSSLIKCNHISEHTYITRWTWEHRLHIGASVQAHRCYYTYMHWIKTACWFFSHHYTKLGSL